MDIHRNSVSTKGDGALNKRLSIRGKYPQIRYFRIYAEISPKVVAQSLWSDIAYTPHVFVLTSFATGPLPAIPDGAVKYTLEEWNLVIKQAFCGVQGSHEIESHTDSEHTCIQLPKPTEGALLSPRHQRVMVILHQKICVGADCANGRAEVYASEYVGTASKDFAEQACVNRCRIDEERSIGIVIDRKCWHGQRSAGAEQVTQQVDHFAGTQWNIIELIP